MKAKEAVDKLNKMEKGDNEDLHIEADNILLEFAPKSVVEAYNKAARRVGFWYA